MLLYGNVPPHAGQGNIIEATFRLNYIAMCRLSPVSSRIVMERGVSRVGSYFLCASVSHIGNGGPGADARGGTELISSIVAGILLTGRVTPCSVFCKAKVVCLFLACAPRRLPGSEAGTPS